MRALDGAVMTELARIEAIETFPPGPPAKTIGRKANKLLLDSDLTFYLHYSPQGVMLEKKLFFFGQVPVVDERIIYTPTVHDVIALARAVDYPKDLDVLAVKGETVELTGAFRRHALGKVIRLIKYVHKLVRGRPRYCDYRRVYHAVKDDPYEAMEEFIAKWREEGIPRNFSPGLLTAGEEAHVRINTTEESDGSGSLDPLET